MFSIQRIEVNTMGYDKTNEIGIRILYMPNWYDIKNLQNPTRVGMFTQKRKFEISPAMYPLTTASYSILK
jgi:hypothetical protein